MMCLKEGGWEGRGEVPPGIWETLRGRPGVALPAQSLQGELSWLPQHRQLTLAVGRQQVPR